MAADILGLGIGNQTLISSLFIFAVIFGVLELSNVFKSRAVHLVIALAIGFFASTYPPLIATLWNFLPNVTWFFIVMFFLAFTMQLLGVRKHGGDVETMVVNAGVLLVMLSVGWMVLQEFPVQFPLIGGGENLLFLLGFIFVVSLFWSAMKMGSGGEGGGKKG
ncbi:MAG: hypothetical protein QXU82_01530 [Candidatus Aenigmatarchaeota archaeon]